MPIKRHRIQGYSDGACKGNKRGGWGVYYTYQTRMLTVEWSHYGGKPVTTNQEMELVGAVELLKLLPVGHDLVCHLDNDYVLKGIITGGRDGIIRLKEDRVNFSGWLSGWIRNGWQTASKGAVKHKEVWQELVRQCQRHLKGGSTLRWVWVRGHSGNVGNEMADRLSNRYCMQ